MTYEYECLNRGEYRSDTIYYSIILNLFSIDHVFYIRCSSVDLNKKFTSGLDKNSMDRTTVLFANFIMQLITSCRKFMQDIFTSDY